jgi:hypothetical protein
MGDTLFFKSGLDCCFLGEIVLTLLSNLGTGATIFLLFDMYLFLIKFTLCLDIGILNELSLFTLGLRVFGILKA